MAVAKYNIHKINVRVVLIEKSPFDVVYKWNPVAIYRVKPCVELKEFIVGLKNLGRIDIITEPISITERFNTEKMEDYYVVIEAKMMFSGLDMRNVCGQIKRKEYHEKYKRIK